MQVNPFEMMALAAAAPQPWPLTGAGTTDALQYIAKQLGLGDPGTEGAGYCYQPTTWDLRAEYCNATQKDSWASTYAGQLDALTYPSDQSFTEDQFNAVVKQLGGDKNAPGEFGMIAPVFDMTAQLQEPIANSQAQTALDIADATSQVESDLTPRWTPSSPTRRRSPTTR